jgi:hypothetical protein
MFYFHRLTIYAIDAQYNWHIQRPTKNRNFRPWGF